VEDAVGRVKGALGRFGEQLAVRHLEAAGFEILDRNWRCAEGEIDIVAADGETLVVCEVKTRSGTSFGDPSEAVVGAKAARVRRLALRWLAARDLRWRDLRFDVVTVLRRREGDPVVRHMRGAF
jgi:putative endonuclease